MAELTAEACAPAPLVADLAHAQPPGGRRQAHPGLRAEEAELTAIARAMRD